MKKLYFLFLMVFMTIVSFGQTIIINEIFADPAGDLSGDANGDGIRNASEDEFIEIYNSGITSIDLENYTLSDLVGLKHVFPSGTILPANSFITVFGGGTPTGINGLFQIASTGTLGLNNGGDAVTLKDASDTTISSIAFGTEVGDDQSIGRSPDFTGSFVKHSTIPGNGGVLFSPGDKNDGSTLSVVKNEIENFVMYPNPVSKGSLFFSSDSREQKQVEIYAQTGQRVYSTIVKTEQVVDISNLNNGLYFVKIIEEGKIATRKLVVN
ncbi:lamin tail domain-containing protein [uncultured Lutibacter sp.]|uniref:lamin tail domain-containing protein n=1 Tax=uncultured Lutibacter sp. TaxID=437739 RepID=UPI002615DDBF|nr:lamin tail domain-containing protein [uncultured Lutibacter sp.]